MEMVIRILIKLIEWSFWFQGKYLFNSLFQQCFQLLLIDTKKFWRQNNNIQKAFLIQH